MRKIRSQNYRHFRRIVSSLLACGILMSMVSTSALAFCNSTLQSHLSIDLRPVGQSFFTHHPSLMGHLPFSEEELSEETEETNDRMLKVALFLALVNLKFEPEIETYSYSNYGDETPLPTRPCYIRYCSLKIPC